ncbi:MAG: hypothetical protein GXP27_00890 [Planctomycetes bacterium]|nr:hypothetical protein [Planctomycetota bacterium]
MATANSSRRPSVPREGSGTPRQEEPQVPAEAAVVETTPVSNEVVDALVAQVGNSALPDQAMRLLGVFASIHSLTDLQQARLKRAYRELERHHTDRLVRFADQWVPWEEMQRALTAEEDILAEAFKLVAQSRVGQAQVRLRNASRTNPEGVRPDFLLGLLYSAAISKADKRESRRIRERNLRHAKEHFRNVLSRWPSNVAALNNLGILEAKSRRYDQALRYWRRAREAEPNAYDVRRNVGRLV